MTTTTTAEAGFVYGIRFRSDREYRYIGITSKSISLRLSQHLKLARKGRKTAFCDWLRKQAPESVVADELQWAWGLKGLGQAEINWIAYLRGDGDRLLNISEGGLGPTGVVWTKEMREAARIRSTGRKVPSRFGEENPFHGRSHTEEQRRKWAQERKGMYSGVENPNFGKFGADHPGFGHVMPEEARKALSKARTGKGNPNYGKTPSAETRTKLSAAQKGKPMPSSRRSAHTRHHTNKDVQKADCKYCIDDSAKRYLPSESESE